MHIGKCHFILAGHSNICGKPNRTSHYHNYNINRVTVVLYAFYSCCTYIDRTAGYLIVISWKWAWNYFLPSCHCNFWGCAFHKWMQVAIALLLYVILHKYVENRWFDIFNSDFLKMSMESFSSFLVPLLVLGLRIP